MRENRPYGSEGGEASSLPDPYRALTTELPIPGNVYDPPERH
jgi:hypothetical protein